MHVSSHPHCVRSSRWPPSPSVMSQSSASIFKPLVISARSKTFAPLPSYQLPSPHMPFSFTLSQPARVVASAFVGNLLEWFVCSSSLRVSRYDAACHAARDVLQYCTKYTLSTVDCSSARDVLQVRLRALPCVCSAAQPGVLRRQRQARRCCMVSSLFWL